MHQITKDIFKQLYRPPTNSHKGQNGKLTIIGGSKLFHGASLWSLKIASRIVDMVFYAPAEENRELTNKLKSALYDFICVPRIEVESYIQESDAVLIGPGLMRDDQLSSKPKLKTQNLDEIDWQEDTFKITQHLLAKFPNKKWIIDAGSLQMMDVEWLKELKSVIITPHRGEFKTLFNIKKKDSFGMQISNIKMKIKNAKIDKQFNHLAIQPLIDLVSAKAKEYGCTIVLKGSTDIVCSPTQCAYDTQGNPGMTKGGTGDVLAGLISALACKNDNFLAACAGVFCQGLAGDRLYKKVGPYYNASDLCDEIPKVLKELME